MKFFSCIPLRVHCWGGLGSQLYALAVAYDLQRKYPKRKIKLLLHTGGLTERICELDFIDSIDFEIIQISDFQIPDNAYKNRVKSNKISVKRLLIKILYFFKFIVSANSEPDFDSVQPWTVSTRGHYVNRKFSTPFYEYLLKHIKPEEKLSSCIQFEIAIHYRLGDLLTLTQKSISPADKIIDLVGQIQKSQNDLKINVYSDSPQIAREMLLSAGLTNEFTVWDLPTIDVIRACIGANYFIGTSSKVSLWIVNIRRYMGESNNNYLEGFDTRLYNPG